MNKLSEFELDMLVLKVTRAAEQDFQEAVLSWLTIWAGLMTGVLIGILAIYFFG